MIKKGSILSNNIKPIKRTRARIFLGKCVYASGRYIQWYITRKKYCKLIEEKLYPNVYFEHKTPLLRRLKNVDMWLQHNKIKNIKIAIKKVNGIVIKPGETFSYWRLIGKPTVKKGYTDGMILFCGGFKAGVGGGLCQLSNLIYWITLHTPLQIVERYRHSYDVFPDSNRTQPFGSGATCVYNYRDLQIYNDTEEAFQLTVYIKDEYLVGKWLTVNEGNLKYEVYEKDHYIKQEFWGGYSRNNILQRKIFSRSGEFLKDEYLTENHAIMMYQPFLEE